MGMFDFVRVRRPLPGDPPAFTKDKKHLFQSKDLDCTCSTYEVTEDGRLVEICPKPAEPHDLQFHGNLEFYGGNVVAASGSQQYTEDGSDAEWVAYVARFVDGNLAEIVETERTREPALSSRDFRAIHPWGKPSAEEIAEEKRRDEESLVGRMMHVLWGGVTPDEGYDVEVVAEGPHEWCLRKPDGRLEVIGRSFRDSIVWDSAEDAARNYSERIEEHRRQEAEFARRLAARGLSSEDA